MATRRTGYESSMGLPNMDPQATANPPMSSGGPGMGAAMKDILPLILKMLQQQQGGLKIPGAPGQGLDPFADV